jgi:hypothetical protein
MGPLIILFQNSMLSIGGILDCKRNLVLGRRLGKSGRKGEEY